MASCVLDRQSRNGPLKSVALDMREVASQSVACRLESLGVQNVRQLGYCGPELLRYCLRRPADLYIMHLEQALCAGVALINRGRAVAVDFEDWYSQDLPLAALSDRPVALLRRCESRLAQKAVYATTTSRCLAEALSREYQSPLPHVVWNAFPWGERLTLDGQFKDRRDRTRLSIVWFSQTVGPGRGLETLMQATHSGARRD